VDFVNENTAIEIPFHLFSEKSNFNITIARAAGVFIKAREWNEVRKLMSRGRGGGPFDLSAWKGRGIGCYKNYLIQELFCP